MAIRIEGGAIVAASGTSSNETRSQRYLDHGSLRRREDRSFQSQQDTSDYTEYRISEDNGKTWGDWVRQAKSTKVWVGEDQHEEGAYPLDRNVWNPVHKHYVSLRYHMIYQDGYEKATRVYWNGGEEHSVHSYVDVKFEQSTGIDSHMIVYEDGSEYDRENYHQTDFLERNNGVALGLQILKNGDILFGLLITPAKAASMAGMDIDRVFSSVPMHYYALLVCRGRWSEELHQYDLSFSEPLLVDDRVSSRGICEPVFAELTSGKILLVFRASNVRYEEWNSRISPYAPNYKWYCLSEDGGKTFSTPMPWHFDTREVIYSSATYSLFLRSKANGKLYWFGNITDPTKTFGNWPRYPLNMVEVDEEWGCAKKDTLITIDTRREGETEEVQLSNFCLLEDRETGNVELYLTKYGQFEGRHMRDCEVWQYTITLE